MCKASKKRRKSKTKYNFLFLDTNSFFIMSVYDMKLCVFFFWFLLFLNIWNLSSQKLRAICETINFNVIQIFRIFVWYLLATEVSHIQKWRTIITHLWKPISFGLHVCFWLISFRHTLVRSFVFEYWVQNEECLEHENQDETIGHEEFQSYLMRIFTCVLCMRQCIAYNYTLYMY